MLKQLQDLGQVGTLGPVSNKLEKHLKRMDFPVVAPCFQKAALLGTAFVLRRLLGISGRSKYARWCGGAMPINRQNTQFAG